MKSSLALPAFESELQIIGCHMLANKNPGMEDSLALSSIHTSMELSHSVVESFRPGCRLSCPQRAV